MLKDPRTYEHVAPEAVGNSRKVLVSNQGHDLLQWGIDQWNRFALWVQGQFRAL